MKFFERFSDMEIAVMLLAALMTMNITINALQFQRVINSSKVSQQIAELTFQNKLLGMQVAGLYEAMTPPYEEDGNAKVTRLVEKFNRGFRINPGGDSAYYGDDITPEWDMSASGGE